MTILDLRRSSQAMTYAHTILYRLILSHLYGNTPENPPPRIWPLITQLFPLATNKPHWLSIPIFHEVKRQSSRYTQRQGRVEFQKPIAKVYRNHILYIKLVFNTIVIFHKRKTHLGTEFDSLPISALAEIRPTLTCIRKIGHCRFVSVGPSERLLDLSKIGTGSIGRST